MSTTVTRRARYESAAAAGFVIAWSSGFVGAKLSTDEASSSTVLMWQIGRAHV